ncbi:MAG: tol-pal system protein YbgF [Candidatus Binatia bacterium]
MIRNRRFPLVAGLTLLVGGGCATQSDVQGVQREGREVRTLVADQGANVETLKREVDSLRGEVEAFRFQSGGSGSQLEQVQRRLDAMEARLASIEMMARGGVPMATGTPGMDATGLPPTGAGGEAEIAVAADAPAEVRDGAEMLRQGDSQGAIQKFREFLRQQPKSPHADDAQYLIGEAYYRSRDFNRAILEFNEVLLRYPKGDRVPAALLRQAFAFAELGDKVDARLVLQKLLSEHATTPEAEKGRQKLAELAA